MKITTKVWSHSDIHTVFQTLQYYSFCCSCCYVYGGKRYYSTSLCDELLNLLYCNNIFSGN